MVHLFFSCHKWVQWDESVKRNWLKGGKSKSTGQMHFVFL